MSVCGGRHPCIGPQLLISVMESSCLVMSIQPPGISDVLASFSFPTGFQLHVAVDEPSASNVVHKHVGWVLVVRCLVCELGWGVTGLRWNSRPPCHG